jgi:hypothetical protein
MSKESASRWAKSDQNPEQWREDFYKWALSRCFWRERSFEYIGYLHADFCEWAIAHDSVPCQREAFERMLADNAFEFADGQIYGMILISTWKQTTGREAPPPGTLRSDGSLVIDPMAPEESVIEPVADQHKPCRPIADTAHHRRTTA